LVILVPTMKRACAKTLAPFTTTLQRIPGKGGWTYVSVPRSLAPPITRAWARTPVHATVDGVAWETSVWRSKTGEGFLPVPKRIRGAKEAGATVTVAFTFVDD
jgi:hypothetical protein